MGLLFVLMGKSAVGKDTVYRELMKDETIGLTKLVEYTTRPIRTGEIDGREYHFTDEAELHRLEAEDRVIECRCYQTVAGPWYYFNVDDGTVSPDMEEDRVVISTLEVYLRFRARFGRKMVRPILIDLTDKERIYRALQREDAMEHPRYDELCRRFLSDSADYAEEKLTEAEIPAEAIFHNGDLAACVAKVRSYILRERGLSKGQDL